MPIPTEVARIEVNGKNYETWETVWVCSEFPNWFRTFRFTVSEGEPLVQSFADLQIKPRDLCKIYLAGQLAVTGIVQTRQAYYDARRHGVLIEGQSLPGETTQTSVDTSDTKGQYPNKSLLQIATEVYKKRKIKVVTRGDTTNMKIPLDRAQVNQGESEFHFVERLARMCQVFIGDDENGNLVLHGPAQSSGGTAQLIEGKNIEWARGTITDIWTMAELQVRGMATGNNKTWGRQITGPSVKVQNNKTNVDPSKKYVMTAERVLSNSKIMPELRRRATYEMNWRDMARVRVEIGVYGWLKADGKLWQAVPMELVHVNSPMLMVNEDLFCHKVTFTQDNEQGTMTTLELLNKEALSGADYQVTGNPA